MDRTLEHNLIALNTPAATSELITLARTDLAAGAAIEVDAKAGVIKNVSIISIGPALGHGFQITKNTLETVVRASQRNDNVKCRITHPDGFWSGKDPIEVTVGRPKNLRVEGDAVRGDIHLADYASKLPGLGDVRGWLLDVAKEDPRVIGISIVAKFSFVKQTDPATGAELKPEALCEFLHAADFVGDPAANRNGLLSAAPGGDRAAPSRTEELVKLNAAQLAYLQSKGLAKDADQATVNAFVAALSAADKAHVESLKTGEPAPAPAPVAPAPQATPTPATPAPAPAALTSEQIATIQLAERTRMTQITTVGKGLGVSDAFIKNGIDKQLSVADFQLAALQDFATRHQPVDGLSTRVSVGDDGRTSMAQAVEDAIFLSYGGQFDAAAGEKAHDRHTEFMGRSILAVARQFLDGLGVNTRAMADMEVAQTVLSKGRLARHIGAIALMHSTSDFPNILANTLRKRMTRQYQEQRSTWEAWANRETVDDFKEVSANSLGHIPTPAKVVEGAEYKYATVGAKREVYSVAKYGSLISFTWEMLINDDLRAFTRRALGFSAASKRLENDLVYAQLTGNQTMTEDSVALFHSSHNNLDQGGAQALGIAPLDDMRAALALQKGIAPSAAVTGPVLNLELETLLVPVGLASVAEQLTASLVKPGGTNNEPNYKFIRSLQVVSDARLDADDTNGYYGISSKTGACETAVVVFLRGYERPTIEEEDNGIPVDGRVFKLRHVCGARIMDWRGFQKNVGA